MSYFHKFFRAILGLGSILWLGGALAKTAIAYDLFNPGTLILKPEYSDAIRLHSVYLFTTISGYTITGFVLVLLSALVLLPSAVKEFKTKGYLLMCYFLLTIFAPIEIYRQYLDIKLALAFKQGLILYGFIDTQISDYFLSQFMGKFGAATVLAFLGFFTCAILLAWRPLYRRPRRISIDE